MARVRTYVYTNGSFDLCSQCDAVNDCCTKAVEVRRAGAREHTMGTCKRNHIRANTCQLRSKRAGSLAGRRPVCTDAMYSSSALTCCATDDRLNAPPSSRRRVAPAGNGTGCMHARAIDRSAPQTAQIKALAIDNGPVVPLTVACRCQAASAS